MDEIQRIILPTDGSPTSHQAQTKGIALARLLKCPILGLYVIDASALEPYPQEALLVDLRSILRAEAEKALEALRAQAQTARVPIETQLKEGNPVEQIVKTARADDLIVIGTHARTGLPRLLLGSLAEDVVRHAPCPVLVVRHTPRR